MSFYRWGDSSTLNGKFKETKSILPQCNFLRTYCHYILRTLCFSLLGDKTVHSVTSLRLASKDPRGDVS